jgi:hypothetical protein
MWKWKYLENWPLLSEEAELAIFRIVHLHSRATVAKIKIEQSPDGVLAAISDPRSKDTGRVLDHSSRTKAVSVGIITVNCIRD